MPVWFENDAPKVTIRSLSFMNQLAIGVPAPTEHTTTEGMVVGDEALALERGGHRGPEMLGQGPHGAHLVAGAGADDEQGAARRLRIRSAASARASAGGAIGPDAGPPAGAAGWRRRDGAAWTSSGSTRWATSRSISAVLQARLTSSA